MLGLDPDMIDDALASGMKTCQASQVNPQPGRSLPPTSESLVCVDRYEDIPYF